VFNVKDRILVKNVYKFKSYGAKISKFPDRGWNVNGLNNYLLKKLRDTGTTEATRKWTTSEYAYLFINSLARTVETLIM